MKRWYFYETDGPQHCCNTLNELNRRGVFNKDIKLGSSGIYYYHTEELF